MGRNERIADNETLFRAANERMAKWPEVEQAATRGEMVAFLCECGYIDCSERVELTGDEYEAVRANSARFAVLPGHELPEAERVVDDHGSYLVVEKHEDVRDIVEATDPRAPRSRS